MKHIVSYILCLMIGVIVAVFINGSGGVIIITSLIVAVILSTVSMNFVKRKITFNLIGDTILLNKFEDVEFKVIMQKNSHIPTPFIEVGFYSSPNLQAVDVERYKISLGTGKSEILKIKYRAEFLGKGRVGIKYVTMTDYLSLFKFTIFKQYNDKSKYIKEVNVLPNIPMLLPQNDIIKNIDGVVLSNDSEEEKTSENGIHTSGIAGYEHKIYSAGDPIKRINWKLSSKRDEYMVRLDEKFTASGIMLIVDCIDNMDKDKSYEGFIKKTDLIIEATLGLAGLMLSSGLECECCFRSEENWNMVNIADENSLINLQTHFSEYTFPKDESQRVPFDLITKNKSKMVVVFSNSVDQSIGYNQRLSEINECSMFYVISEIDKENILDCENVWTVNELFEFSKQSL